MSEETNINSSKIQTGLECGDIPCSIPTNEANESKNENSPPLPVSRECVDEGKIDTLTPEDAEFKEMATPISRSGDFGNNSSNDEYKIRSSTIQASESRKMYSSTVPTTESSFSTTESETSSSSHGSSNHKHIEESILKMIKHIEKEIESEEHVGLNENHFQNIEINIKTSRVMVAIEQTIEKLEIAFCLPWIFVENMKEITMFCGEKNVNKLMNAFCKIRDVEGMDVCRYQPAVINCINDAFEAGLGRFVSPHRRKLSESETKFISTMVQFKCMAEWQMGMSAIKAMNKEKTLHKMWSSNEKIKLKIKEMEMQCENYRKKLQDLLDEKNKIIATHKQTISHLEKHNTIEINAEIFKSNKAMQRVCVNSEERQKVLTADLEKTKEIYEKLVQSNLLRERTLRDKKSKTRQKLQAILNKYDTGVGERFAELLRIRTELENETALYETKVMEFQRQELEYNQIMADKAEVDAKIREEKLLLFMMNRSAKIIQRAYKKMMKKKKKGKKGKKGKKNMKPKK